MTLGKANHLQEDLRKLFHKYGVQGGGIFFVHADQFHILEVHGTERNPWVIAVMDAMQVAIPAAAPDIPVVNFNNNQQN